MIQSIKDINNDAFKYKNIISIKDLNHKNLVKCSFYRLKKYRIDKRYKNTIILKSSYCYYGFISNIIRSFDNMKIVNEENRKDDDFLHIDKAMTCYINSHNTSLISIPNLKRIYNNKKQLLKDRWMC